MEYVPLHSGECNGTKCIVLLHSINPIRQNASHTVSAIYLHPIPTIWQMWFYAKHSKWRELVESLVVSNSLFWYYIKQIMNVFIRAMVRIFSFGERWNVPFNSAVASLNGTFHLSPHENILTIALINIHYLYNITLSILSDTMLVIILSCYCDNVRTPIMILLYYDTVVHRMLLSYYHATYR